MQRMMQNIYMVPLFLSMLAGFRSFRQGWPAAYRTFSILLVGIFVVELLAICWKYYFYRFGFGSHSPNNLRLYNTFLIPQYLLYMVVYYQVIGSRRIRLLILVLAVVYTAFSLVDEWYFQGPDNINSWTLALASSIVIFLTVTYFNRLLKDKEIIRLSRHPMVWISAGALIFHAADLPYILSLNYLIRYDLQLALALIYIFVALNFLMYSLYTIAYLCPPPPHKP